MGCAVGAACFPPSAPALLLARGFIQAGGASSLIYGITNMFIDKNKNEDNINQILSSKNISQYEK